MERETILYRGKKYHRYPQSKRRQHKVYFWRHDKWKKPPFPLHRQIWIDNFGEIPKNFIIHHKDKNTLNNSIENLEILSRSEHAKKHSLEKDRVEFFIKNGKKQADRIVKDLKKWRENNPKIAKRIYSENGKKQSERIRRILKEWKANNPKKAKELYQKNYKYLFFEEPQKATCKQCKKKFSYTSKRGGKFCSRKCSNKFSYEKRKSLQSSNSK